MTKSKSKIACDIANPPFPSAVCEPFTLSNGTIAAVFFNDPSKDKKLGNTMKIIDTNQDGTTIWVPGKENKTVDYCNNANDVHSGHVNPHMPLVSDCLAIQEWAAANAGHWVVSKADMDKHRWTTLSVVGTCALVVGTFEQNGPGSGIVIGNKDVKEIIQQSIEKHQIGDRVEVSGRSVCGTWKEGWAMVATDWDTLAAAATPIAQGNGAIRDPACGSLCAFTEPPFETAICYEVKLDDGTCHTVFVNPKAGNLDFGSVEGTFGPGVKVKRSEMKVDKGYYDIESTATPSPQKVCGDQALHCHSRRDYFARTDDCKALIYFWSSNHGKWVISDLDLVGRRWIGLMSSGTCHFSVGNAITGVPGSPIINKETSLGNLDIEVILADGIHRCKTDGGMEFRGIVNCNAFPLLFWVTATDKFDCCKGDDSDSPAANASALFLGSRVSFSAAKAACKELGEELWSPESNNTQRILDILDFQEPDIDLTAIWVASTSANPKTINLKSNISFAEPFASNPVLCMHTAPFSNGVSQDTSERWQVTIPSNNEDVLGFRDRNSFRFQGMRFATNTTRFTYPKLYVGSGGNISALEFGSPCYQSFGGSEDCHFLNIYTTHLPHDRQTNTGLRPVMFWIHGGALTSGYGSDALFDGGNLASRGDVVVVTINYRLGTLGYLALDDGETNGNFGLADQILALDWVQENIRDFGGDPNRITIFGQSAGAGSVRAMMASPKAVGKFAAAIPLSNLGGLQYGKTYSKYYTIEEQLHVVGNAILGTTNCTNATSQVACLRRKPAASLGSGARYLVNDGTFLNSSELQLKGDPLNVHLMMGITSEDGLPFLIFPRNGTVVNDTLWLTAQGLPEPPSSLFPVLETESNNTRAAFGVGARLATDAMFRCIDQATVYAGLDSGVLGPQVYYYEFERTYQTPGWPRLDICEAPISMAHPDGDPSSGTNNLRCHSGELLPLFGNIARQGLPFRDENDLPWQQYIVDTFSSFARTYNPNPDKAFLRARGFDSTMRAQETTGPWVPSVRGSMKMRSIDWPVKEEMMKGFKDTEQCGWLKLPLDYYI
ncbi:hypothetical protein EsH8_IV_000485 [Colletotrichum jinshuiense]